MPDNWTAADAYDQYVGRWSRLLAPKFLQWANVSKRGVALDVGCGTGALSEALIEHGVGSLTGIDPSEAYVEAARKRLTRPSTPTHFDVGDATKLPYPKGRFDDVVSGLVLNFVPQPLEAAREMLRVTRQGGRVAAYVWDYAGRMEMIRAFWNAAVEQNPLRAGRMDEGRRFPLCQPQRLEELFRNVGFKDVRTDHIDQPTPFQDFDEFWRPFLGGQGPAPTYYASLTEPERADLKERVRKHVRPGPDGKILMIARAFAVQGTA